MKPFQHSLLICACLGILAVGCGGGGGSTTASATPATPALNGDIIVTLAPAKQVTADVIKTDSTTPTTMGQTLPEPTNIRFVVRNPTTGFSNVQDVPVSGSSSVDIKVPVGSGYILDAISSVLAKTIDANAPFTNYMLKSGEATDIAVTADATTQVTLNLAPFVTTLTVPTSIDEGTTLNVDSTNSAPGMIGGMDNLRASTSPITGIPNLVGAAWGLVNFSFTAPMVADAGGNYIAGTEYFQVWCTMNWNFGLNNDSQQWGYVYPNTILGDAQISCPLAPPTGGITVGVNY